MWIGGGQYPKIFATNQRVICSRPFCEIVRQNPNSNIIFDIMICQKIIPNGTMNNILQIGGVLPSGWLLAVNFLNDSTEQLRL